MSKCCPHPHPSTTSPSPSPHHSGDQLSPQQIDGLVEIVREYVNIYKIIYFIDQVEADRFKHRNQYYFGVKHSHQHERDTKDTKHNCCSGSFNRIYSPKQEQSIYERQLEELLSPSSLKGGLLAELLNHCGSSFFRIKNNGIKEGLPWDDDNEVYLLGKTMEEGLLMFFVNRLKSTITEKQKVDSRQPMLYANAATWKARYPNIELNFLQSGVIESIVTKGYGIQKKYMFQDHSYLLKQLDWIEKDGKFQESLADPEVRNDRGLWVSTVDDKEYPETSEILKQMSAIQFQINTKTNLGCSLSEMYMFSYFKEKGFHKRHQDSGVSSDTGKKFTVILALERTEVTLYSGDGVETELTMEARDLLILKSRVFSYETKCPNPRSFMLRYWISGPKQPEA